MAEPTYYDVYKDTPKYQLPHEKEALRREWWTATQAARAWGVNAKTARRLFETMDEVTSVLTINVRTDARKVLRCVRAGTLRPPVRRGNPRFLDPEWQQANSARRWDGHITAAEIKTMKDEMNAAAFEEVVEWAEQFLPQDDDDGIDDWEPPESSPDPDPPPPHFLFAFEREVYEEKQKRLARGCTH